MRKIERLQRSARDSAQRRGHALGRWQRLGDSSCLAACRRCGREVVVCAHPAPNEIEIAGEAVALGCQEANNA